MKEIKKRRRKTINARKRKVWWRKNWQLVLAMIFSFIIATIFVFFVFWYMREINQMMFGGE